MLLTLILVGYFVTAGLLLYAGHHNRVFFAGGSRFMPHWLRDTFGVIGFIYCTPCLVCIAFMLVVCGVFSELIDMLNDKPKKVTC